MSFTPCYPRHYPHASICVQFDRFARRTDTRFRLIDAASRLLVLGSTLATYSAFRLIKRAYEAGKPVLLLSQGPSRADDLDVFRMDRVAGPVMRAALEDLMR